MWLRIDNPEYGSSNYVIVNYNDKHKFSETEICGKDDDINPVIIKIEIEKIRNLFLKQMKDIYEKSLFRLPQKNEIVIVMVKRGEDSKGDYNGIKIIDNKREEPYGYNAFIDENPIKKGSLWIPRDKIIMPCPPKDGTIKSIFNHELGHWFFDKIGDELAKEYGFLYRRYIEVPDNKRCKDDTVVEYDDFNEMVAYYCQEYFNEKINRENHPHENILKELDRIVEKNPEDPLKTIHGSLVEICKRAKN